MKIHAERAGTPASLQGPAAQPSNPVEGLAGLQGKPLGDVMAMSGHKTAAVAMGYYQAGVAVHNSAAKLAG